ncbi:HNH endonuclease [Burkholderia ambifaria]|uniref:HNH endonuclease n=1 Tax=Burkholderia ambifaria TaxID=152480 RepID=UPI00158916FC|nr:HNH endonuclease [Burkholderia ambifaria]MBR8345785.1 HNH endonuclease [Burkholderia ambifaria]
MIVANQNAESPRVLPALHAFCNACAFVLTVRIRAIHNALEVENAIETLKRPLSKPGGEEPSARNVPGTKTSYETTMPNREDFNEDEVRLAYSVARSVVRGELKGNAAKHLLIEQLKAKPYTAQTFIEAYPAMLGGLRYKKTLSDLAVKNYVEAITKEFGLAARTLALQAVLKNIEFWEENESKRRGKPTVRKSQRALHQKLLATTHEIFVYPDEVVVPPKTYVEGAVSQVLINRYERDLGAREAAIAHYGCSCYVCGFEFGKKYGVLGQGFIHVHHVVDIATIGAEYHVDPVKDLRPVCPNCHAMLHKTTPAMDIDELRDLIAPTMPFSGA